MTGGRKNVQKPLPTQIKVLIEAHIKFEGLKERAERVGLADQESLWFGVVGDIHKWLLVAAKSARVTEEQILQALEQARKANVPER